MKNQQKMVITEQDISVSESLCRLLGSILSGVQFRGEFYQRPFLQNSLPYHRKALMYFFAVGICHQTHALADLEKNLYGWDYLEHGFLQAFLSGSSISNPQWITSTEDEKVGQELQSFFIPQGKTLSTLDRIEERVYLLKDLATKLIKNHEGDFMHLLQRSAHKVGGQDGLYALLSEFDAYSDPLKKKSSFLIKLLMDGGLYQVTDPENLNPIMDYHMQRVLLRTGAVEIRPPELRNILSERKSLSDETAIREACIHAVREISSIAGIPILQMNDIFYMLGRSCCYEQPKCEYHSCAKSPCSLTLTIHLGEHERCLLEDVCKGAKLLDYRRLWHPIVNTHFY